MHLTEQDNSITIKSTDNVHVFVLQKTHKKAPVFTAKTGAIRPYSSDGNSVHYWSHKKQYHFMEVKRNENYSGH